MANRTRIARVQRVQRQPTSWGRFVFDFTTVALSTKVLLGTFALNNPGIGETIRRTRGLISVASDQSGAVEGQLGAIGFVVVSDLAAAAGAASIPGPVTDAADDGWFVWEPIVQFSSIVGAAAGRGASYPFDSKAMRKVQ